MIEEIEASGINGIVNVKAVLNSDINVITGRNGSGKTTIMKLMWYLISGNMERIPLEMDFNYVRLKTTNSSIELEKSSKDSTVLSFRAKANDWSKNGKFTLQELIEERTEVHELNMALARANTSVFFPTFRRIEGGFSVEASKELNSRVPVNRLRYYGDADVQDVLNRLSEQLSVLNHKFICSISTSDIVNLLTRRYANISQKTNEAHGVLVNTIISEIESRNPENTYKLPNETRQLNSAIKTISAIQSLTTDYQSRQEELLKPFSRLSDFITEIFNKKGIKITENIGLGYEDERISSNMLSAGEKQILSFLVYNVFYQDTPIFIDEPELSLHVDWQRAMFPLLLQQQTTNQFIIATHSPFIYSRYSDKEIVLEETRGST